MRDIIILHTWGKPEALVLDEADRQMIILALARLGWLPACENRG